jgi:bacillithiol biosynthesis cysteine-adding enzyme BshC
MKLIKETIPFADTHAFSQMAIDYVGNHEGLRGLINEFPSLSAIEDQIIRRKQAFNKSICKSADRSLLQQVIRKQYASLDIHPEVQKQIDLLTAENTFTICTAHQPCIFTGPLYFMYKIAHAIRLASECNRQWPAYHFVPVFYMGTEDNDLDEIGTIHIDHQTYKWSTTQTGACGRMQTADLKPVTDQLVALLNLDIADEAWLAALIEQAYNRGHTLADATRIMVNGLFEHQGLLILDADETQLKSLFAPLMEDELFNQHSSAEVQMAAGEISKHYKVQAAGRDINMFYLKEQLRERIEKKNDRWVVNNTAISFTEEELRSELQQWPERFSPNVILRPLYQEMLLPNVAFVGGGGELAYWLELKSLFGHYDIPYPLIFLRNSFLMIDHLVQNNISDLQLSNTDLFLPPEKLYLKLLSENAALHTLEQKLQLLEEVYRDIETLSRPIGVNLSTSIKAHHAKANKISARMAQKFRAYLKKAESEKILKADKIKAALFPSGSLQERHDNFIPYFKKYGKRWIELLIQNQSGAEAEFIILKENE